MVVVFKVKSVDDTNNIKITYTPDDPSVLNGDKSYDYVYNIVDNAEDNGSINQDSDAISVENKHDKQDLLLYAPWILSGISIIALIIVALKRK